MSCSCHFRSGTSAGTHSIATFEYTGKLVPSKQRREAHEIRRSKIFDYRCAYRNIDNDPNEGETVKAQVNHFDFSSHSGKAQLLELLDQINFNGDKKVYCVHGDEEVMLDFKAHIESLGYKAEAPERGQSFNI